MTEENCKNCGYKLITKATKKTPGQTRKPYYYTAYYFCNRCKKLYHSDKFKVITNPLFEKEKKAPDNPTSDTLQTYDAQIWTDGACVGNGTPRARAAWAFVAKQSASGGSSGETERAGLVQGKQTNNVAEGLAIYHALKWAAEMKFKKIKICTDSQISLFNVKKPASKVIQNREIFEKIEAVIATNNLKVTYEKVLGHSGDPNNERADKLCNGLAVKG